MMEKLTLRITSAEKEELIKNASQLGYHSVSDYTRKLIVSQLRNDRVGETERHIFTNSLQSLFMLREVIRLLSNDPSSGEKAIRDIKEKVASIAKQHRLAMEGGEQA